MKLDSYIATDITEFTKKKHTILIRLGRTIHREKNKFKYCVVLKPHREIGLSGLLKSFLFT